MKALNLFLVWALAAWTAGAAVSVTPVGTGTGLDTNNPVAFGTNVGVAGSLSVVGALNAGEVAGAGALLVSNLTASRVLGTDADGYVTNLPAGTSGQVLKSTGSGYTWGSGGSSNLSDSAFTVVLNGDLQGSNSISASNLYGGTVNIGGTNATTLMAAYASAASGGSASNAVESWYNLCDYGGVGDCATDNTMALSNLLYDVDTDFAGRAICATVFAPAGQYAFSTAPFNPAGENAVVVIPRRGASPQTGSLRFLGVAPGPCQDDGSNPNTARSTNGTIFYCTVTNGNFIASTNCTYNWINISFENISIHVPDKNFTDWALNLTNFVCQELYNVNISTRTKHGGLADTPLASSGGLSAPMPGMSSKMVLNNVDISGFGTGLRLGEHGTIGQLLICGNLHGIDFHSGGKHGNEIARLMTAANSYPLWGNAATKLHINFWANERIDETDWRSNTLDIASLNNISLTVDALYILDDINSTKSDKLNFSGASENSRITFASDPFAILCLSNSASATYKRGPYLRQFSANTVGPSLSMFKGRGSEYAPAAAAANDNSGYFRMGGHDGTDYTTAAALSTELVSVTTGKITGRFNVHMYVDGVYQTNLSVFTNGVWNRGSWTNWGGMHVVGSTYLSTVTMTNAPTIQATNFVIGCTDGVGSWKVGIAPDGTLAVVTNAP